MATFSWSYTDENGEEVDVELPARWDICSTCYGEGRHSLAIDGHGISEEERERDWDPESWADYLAGEYDSPCQDCKSNGKVLVVDVEALEPDLAKRYEEHLCEEATYQALCRAERRFGA